MASVPTDERRKSERGTDVSTKSERSEQVKEQIPADNTVIPQSEELSFEDTDEFPEGAQLDALTNVFQAKVNELAQSGKATKFTYPAENEKWALNKIRRAANNINKGAKTRTFPVDGDPSKILIWFKIGDKISRPRRNSNR